MRNARNPAPSRLLCLDIETVPDRERLPADWGGKFPKPLHHAVAAISFVEADIVYEADGTERYEVVACRSGGRVDWGEAQLLQSFWAFFAGRPTRCCTWNGRAFDFPVVLQRSMIHGLSARAWFAGTRYEGFTHRYSPEYHCDLMDVVADYGASTKLSLDETAVAVGMPGKVGGHGSEVEAMVKAGAIEQVRRYCEADCLNLFGIYVRHALLTGRTGRAGHDASLDSLEAYLRRGREAGPHFAEFLDMWRPGEPTAGVARSCRPGPAARPLSPRRQDPAAAPDCASPPAKAGSRARITRKASATEETASGTGGG